MAGSLVMTASEVPVATVPALIRDLSTTRQKLAYPSGAKFVSIMYKLLPGATATANQFAKVVINATSDADADGKLSVDGSNIVICQGDDLIVYASTDSPIYRIDVKTEIAVGTEKTIFQVIAGV